MGPFMVVTVFSLKNEHKVGGKLLPQLASHGNMLKVEFDTCQITTTKWHSPLFPPFFSTG